MNVLIVGDDARSLELLALVIRQGNWLPLTAYTFHDAVAHHEKTPVNLVLVESNGSLTDQIALCQALKQRLVVPIIVITPWTDEASQRSLYEGGADDCVLRPYSPRLLEAKIRSLLRLCGSVPLATLSLVESGAVALDPERHTVTLKGGEPLRLTPLEFRLLYALISNSGRVLPADTLIYKIWGYTGEGNRDLLKQLVSRLRSKLEPEARVPRYIRTIPGVGYSFSPTEDG